MKHLYIIALILVGVSCATKPIHKHSLKTGGKGIDLSDYTMVCFDNQYIKDNNVEIPNNGQISVRYSEDGICVNKKEYITYHLSHKAFLGDSNAIELLLTLHKSLYRRDNINSPTYYNNLRGEKLFNYYYQRFQSNPCQKATEECQSSYVALNDFVQMIRMIDHINGQDPSEYIDNNLSPNITLKSKIENCNDTHYQNHIAMLETINNAIAKDWVKLKEFGQE